MKNKIKINMNKEMSKAKTEDRMKVHGGKMEVERLRERLIRELREGGSQEGKRQKRIG